MCSSAHSVWPKVDCQDGCAQIEMHSVGHVGLAGCSSSRCSCQYSNVLRGKGLHSRRCVTQVAKEAGVVSIAVPPPLSARGTFPYADYSFDGFGPGGGITWRRTAGILDKHSA